VAAAALTQLGGAGLFARRRVLRISALESFSSAGSSRTCPVRTRASGGRDQLEASLRYADFERERVDAAIRFARAWRACTRPILDLDFFPVCSPGLASPARPCASG
jgi:hypothetical protein